MGIFYHSQHSFRENIHALSAHRHHLAIYYDMALKVTKRATKPNAGIPAWHTNTYKRLKHFLASYFAGRGLGDMAGLFVAGGCRRFEGVTPCAGGYFAPCMLEAQGAEEVESSFAFFGGEHSWWLDDAEQLVGGGVRVVVTALCRHQGLGIAQLTRHEFHLVPCHDGLLRAAQEAAWVLWTKGLWEEGMVVEQQLHSAVAASGMF